MFMTPISESSSLWKKEHVNMYLWNQANTVVIVVVVFMPTDEGGPEKKKTLKH
jgi:hypothetical protein